MPVGKIYGDGIIIPSPYIIFERLRRKRVDRIEKSHIIKCNICASYEG